MLSLLQCEFIKLKRSRFLFIGLLGTLITPILVVATALIQYFIRPGASISLFSLCDDTLTIVIWLVGPLVLTILGAWAISREYTEGTLKNIFVIPVSPTFFLIGKLLFFVALSLAFMAITWMEIVILAYLCGCFFPVENINIMSAFYFLIMWMLPGGMLLCATLTPFIYLTIRTKGFVTPLVAVTATLVVNVLISISPVAGFYPWTASYYLARGATSRLGCPKEISLFIIAIVCLSGIAASLIRFQKEDD